MENFNPKLSFLSSVYIIIPVHNRKKITLTCLKQLQENGDLDHYSVVVVDDGSTDGTAEAVQSQFPIVKILHGDGNLWWTGAIKMGMEYAYKNGSEYFIWLNDDCLPQRNTLNLLVNFSNSHANTITGAACYLIGKETPIETGCLGRKRLAVLPTKVNYVDSLSGYCVCLPRSVCETIGFPNAKHLPHYGGDDTYILQATRAGLKAVLLGDAKIILRETNSAPQSFIKYLKNISYVNLHTIFFRKKSQYYLPGKFFHLRIKYGKVKGFLFFLIKLLVWTSQYLLYSIKNFFVNNSYNFNKLYKK